MRISNDQTADSIKNYTFYPAVEDSFIDKLPVINNYFFDMKI
jgi:hypothetical protein